MGTLGENVKERIVLYAQQNLPLASMHFNSLQRLRILIAEQLFQVYSSGRVPMTTPPNKTVRQVAARVYNQVLNGTDPMLKKIREDCNITESSKRTYAEMTKDIEVYEVFQNIWGVDTKHHDKAVCKDAAYEMINLGYKTGDARALASGVDRLSKLNNDFQEAAEDFANTADTEIDISSDVQLVRKDAQNFSRSAIDDIKKKYGANIGKVEDLIQTDDGAFEVAPEQPLVEQEDFFVAEEERLSR